MKRWFVYIIANPRREAYTGITFDETPERRVNEHNAADQAGARYTRGRGPWSLIYAESGFASRAAAQAREASLRKDARFKRALKENLRIPGKS